MVWIGLDRVESRNFLRGFMNMNSERRSMSRPGPPVTPPKPVGRPVAPPRSSKTSSPFLSILPLPSSHLRQVFWLYIPPMRGCLKHHSPSNSTIATPPPTRDPTPPLIPPDAPSLAVKRRTPPSLSDECLSRRCVHFCNEIVDKIFVADEWDRSPAEVTPRLTYQ